MNFQSPEIFLEIDKEINKIRSIDIRTMITTIKDSFQNITVKLEQDLTMRNVKWFEQFFDENLLPEFVACFTKMYTDLVSDKTVERDNDTAQLVTILELSFKLFCNINVIARKKKLTELVLLWKSNQDCQNFSYFLEDNMYQSFIGMCANDTSKDKVLFCGQFKRYFMLKRELDLKFLTFRPNDGSSSSISSRTSTRDHRRTVFNELTNRMHELTSTYLKLMPMIFQFVFLNYQSFFRGELRCAIKFAQQQLQIFHEHRRQLSRFNQNISHQPDFSVIKER